MLKKSFITTVIVALFTMMGTLNAQQKYAVIIGGNMNPGTTIPDTEQWNGGDDPHPLYGFDEFWNDSYLMWEMLVFDKEFTDANVHVLFGQNGQDFTFYQQDIRYKAIYHQGYQVVTDANSNLSTIEDLFENVLAPVITEDDFLFVWIMSHGGTDANGSYFYSYDNQKVYDSGLATWLGSIAAHKKVVFLSFPNSGGFIPELEDEGVIVVTAGGAAEGASRADDSAPNMAFVENEVRENITYNHGEINYHLFSSLTGKTPFDEIVYAGTNLSVADVDSDNYITILETLNWTSSKETAIQTPGYSDPGNILTTTELEYPTLLHQSLPSGNNVSYRGLIGISKHYNIVSGSSLRFQNNSKIFFLNPGKNFQADAGSILIIDDNASISTNNPSNVILIFTNSFSIGNNITFKSDSWTNYLSIGCQNFSLNLSINNLHSTNCSLTFDINSVSIANSIFTNSLLTLSSNTAMTTNSVFYSSILNNLESNDVSVSFCNFTVESTCNDENRYEIVAIGIENCQSFRIDNSTITGYKIAGIYVLNSGKKN